MHNNYKLLVKFTTMEVKEEIHGGRTMYRCHDGTHWFPCFYTKYEAISGALRVLFYYRHVLNIVEDKRPLQEQLAHK